MKNAKSCMNKLFGKVLANVNNRFKPLINKALSVYGASGKLALKPLIEKLKLSLPEAPYSVNKIN